MVDSKVYRNSAIYTVCNFALKAMSFLLLPLYAAFLTTADYGVTGLMDRFVGVATVLSTFSLQAGVMRFYVDYRDNGEELPSFIGTVFCFAFLSTLAFDALFFGLRDLLVPAIFKGIDFIPTVAITLSGLCFTNVYGIYQQVLRGMEQARTSALTSVAYLVLNVSFTILFVVGFGMGADGSLLGTAMAGICLSVFAAVHLTRIGMFHPCVKPSIVHEMLRYTVPLMPHNLSTQIAQLVSGVLINSGGALASVGLYNVAYKFGMACDTLQSSVSVAYQPWLFRMLEGRPEGYRGQIVEFTTTLLDVYTLAFCALGLFIREPIILLLNDSYASAWMLVPPIVLVYAAKSAYYFYIGVLLYYKEATRTLFLATVSSSLLNVMLTFWMVPPWGAYGSILSDGLSMVLRVGLVIWMASHYEDSGYRIRQFVVPFLTVAGVLALGLTPCYLDPYAVSLSLFGWRVALYAALFALILSRHPGMVAGIRGRLAGRAGFRADDRKGD